MADKPKLIETTEEGGTKFCNDIEEATQYIESQIVR